MDPNAEQIHRLADTTYRNTEELATDLRTLVGAAKHYHKAMQGVMSSSKSFFVTMESIGAKASNLPGSVRKLGDCMMEIVSGYKQVFRQYSELIVSLNSDFIVPLETKLDSEEKDYAIMHKSYKQESSKRQAMVDKTSKKLESIQKKKKPSREQLEKEAQLKQVLADNSEELHSTRVEGLRRALIEERKLYCFVVDHFCSVIHNDIAVNALSHRTLSSKVTDWSTLCTSPSELPPESAALLTNPRAPRAFPISPSEERTPAPWDHEASPRSVQQGAGGGRGNGVLKRRRSSCRVRALYGHGHSGTTGQLEFNPGDLIDAIDDPQEGWQFGENIRTGRGGWFPVQYVDKVWPTPEPQRHRRGDSREERPTNGGSGGEGGRPHPFHSPSIPDRDYGHSPLHSSTLPPPSVWPGSAERQHMSRKISSGSVTSGQPYNY